MNILKIFLRHWRRILAFFTDYMVVFTIILAVSYPILKLSKDASPDMQFNISQIIVWSILVAYGALFESSVYRRTPGKMIFRLAVISKDGTQLSFMYAVVRNFLKWFFTPFPIMVGMVLIHAALAGYQHDKFVENMLVLSSLLVFVNIILLKINEKPFHDLVIGSNLHVLNKGLKGKLDRKRVIGGPKLSFNTYEEAGAYGETMLAKELDQLASRSIVYHHGSTGNLVHNGSNFQIDSYALVSGMGLLLIEAKFYSGEIHLSDYDHWDIYQHRQNAPKENPCIQLSRTTDLFRSLLQANDLLRWPITPIVVLVHPDSILIRGKSKPAFPVVELHALEDWIIEQNTDDKIVFSEQDRDLINDVLKRHERQYIESPIIVN